MDINITRTKTMEEEDIETGSKPIESVSEKSMFLNIMGFLSVVCVTYGLCLQHQNRIPIDNF